MSIDILQNSNDRIHRNTEVSQAIRFLTVRVPDVRDELHLRRFDGIFSGKREMSFEKSSLTAGNDEN